VFRRNKLRLFLEKDFDPTVDKQGHRASLVGSLDRRLSDKDPTAQDQPSTSDGSFQHLNLDLGLTSGEEAFGPKQMSQCRTKPGPMGGIDPGSFCPGRPHQLEPVR
jgi:hypothetical protein